MSAYRTDILEQAKAIKRKQVAVFSEAVDAVMASAAIPSETVGILIDGIPAWVPGKTYEKANTLFTYNGAVGFTRQPNLTAQEIYPPFSVGTEALYGARPAPDADGIYPYTYNMAAREGMRVREGNEVYECYQRIDVMLYPPSQLAAHFRKEA